MISGKLCFMNQLFRHKVLTFNVVVWSIILCSCYQALCQKQGKPLIDSLLQELDHIKKDTIRQKVLHDLAYTYASIDPNVSLNYANQELDLANKMHWSFAVANAYSDMGNAQYFSSQYDQSKKSFQKAFEIYKQLNKKSAIAVALMNLGNVSMKQSDYPNALQQFLDALNIDEKINDKNNIAMVNANIGNLYLIEGDTSKAISYLNKSLDVYESQKDVYDAAIVYGNIGVIYYQQTLFDKALTYLHKALEIHTSLGNTDYISLTTIDIAGVFAMQKKYDSSIYYCFKGLEIDEKTNNKEGILMALGNIGGTYLAFVSDSTYKPQKGKYISANRSINIRQGILYTERALKIADEIKNLDYKLAALYNLSELQFLLGDHMASHITNIKYQQLKDSIFSAVNTKKITEMQDKFDFKKKQDSTEQAHEKQIAIDEERHRANMSLLIIIALFVVIMISLAFYFNRKIEHAKFSTVLAELKQNALSAQMSDHFIGNTMDSIYFFLRHNEKDKASEYLILFKQLIKQVMVNSSKKNITLEEDLLILNRYLDLEKVNFPEGLLSYVINIAPDINVNSTLVPPMLAQIFVENSLKHGFEKNVGGNLSISIKKNIDLLEYAIEDNGKGRGAIIARDEHDIASSTFLGSKLAEALIKLRTSGTNINYSISDLRDNNGNSLGTRVTYAFSLLEEV